MWHSKSSKYVERELTKRSILLFKKGSSKNEHIPGHTQWHNQGGSWALDPWDKYLAHPKKFRQWKENSSFVSTYLSTSARNFWGQFYERNESKILQYMYFSPALLPTLNWGPPKNKARYAPVLQTNIYIFVVEYHFTQNFHVMKYFYSNSLRSKT